MVFTGESFLTLRADASLQLRAASREAIASPVKLQHCERGVPRLQEMDECLR